MTTVLCIHCSSAPIERRQEGTGLIMWICALCSNRGDATRCAARAKASWQLVNDPDMPVHTCKAKATPRFFMSGGKWGSRCPGCDFVAPGYATIEGARSAWARSM
jgi:hypothetical protein